MELHHKGIGDNTQPISTLRRFEGSYDWRGLEFPLPLSKICIFKQNNVSVNVLAIGGGKEKLYILRKAKSYNQRRTTNLLQIVQEKKMHYVTIKNLSRLLVICNSSNGHQDHFCLNCLRGFPSEESRNKHFDYCIDHEVVRIDMLEENSFVRSHSGSNTSSRFPSSSMLTSKRFSKVRRKRPILSNQIDIFLHGARLKNCP